MTPLIPARYWPVWLRATAATRARLLLEMAQRVDAGGHLKEEVEKLP